MKKTLALFITVIFVISSFSFASFGIQYTYDSRVKEIQQYLNKNYSAYTGYVYSGGIVYPPLYKSLIRALQAAEGIPKSSVTGAFGPTTKKCCPTLPYKKNSKAARSYSKKYYTKGQIKKFTRLLQFALYINGFDTGEFDGVFDSRVKKALSDFKTLMCMEINSKADLATWMALLTAPGDTSRKAKAADTATILSKTQADYLYSKGYRYIGRYLTNASSGYDKALTPKEAEIILSAGLNFFPIYQTTGRKASYFTAKNGAEDAEKAIKAARKLGLPGDTVIYFAVDYDATLSQINTNIIPYFERVYQKMKKSPYRVGIYGARGVCSAVSDEGYAEYSFVSSLSSAFYANAGFKMPENWAFNQFSENIYKDYSKGIYYLAIDKNDYSGRDEGVSYLIPGHTHSYTSSVIRKATCSKTGKILYECECGDSYTSSVAKKDHTPVTDKAVSPTYKKPGKTKGSHCEVCGEIIKAQKTVARLELGRVKELTVSKTYTDRITLSWKKVKGAEGYKVSYSTDGKKWTSLTSEDTAVTVTKLKKGQSYRFKVRATAGSNKGTYSSVLSTATKVGKTEIKSIKSRKKGTVTVEWSKLRGANGYRLYLSSKKDYPAESTEKVTVKGGKTLETTVNGLRKGRKYFVRIRGFKTVNNKKVFGTYSSVKSIRIK